MWIHRSQDYDYMRRVQIWSFPEQPALKIIVFSVKLCRLSKHYDENNGHTSYRLDRLSRCFALNAFDNNEFGNNKYQGQGYLCWFRPLSFLDVKAIYHAISPYFRSPLNKSFLQIVIKISFNILTMVYWPFQLLPLVCRVEPSYQGDIPETYHTVPIFRVSLLSGL